MSRIGNKIIQIPENVKIDVDQHCVKIGGPKGNLEVLVPKNLQIKINDNQIEVKRKRNDKFSKSIHGTVRNLIANAIWGVSEGFVKKLEFVGVGFRAEVNGNKLTLNMGFSHPKTVIAPEDITMGVEKNVISVAGIDKQAVGSIAAVIRSQKPVEPYKGKGIYYQGEIIRRKPGKTVAKAGVGSGE
jgi:large subunit ribosomal protein L6